MANDKIMQKKYKYIFKKVNKEIHKIINIFYSLRTIMNSQGHDYKSLEKKYKGIVKIGTTDDNGTQVKCIKIYDKKDTSKLKYEITYGITGVSIKITDNPNHKGIHFVRYSDFDCKKIKEVIYNYHVPDRIESYKMKFNDAKNVKVKTNFIDRENMNFLGKVWAYLREKKYIY